MFEERIAVGHLPTDTAVLHNDFQIDQVRDRLREEVQLRNANFIRNGSPFVLDHEESAVVHVARHPPTRVEPSANSLSSSPWRSVLST